MNGFSLIFSCSYDNELQLNVQRVKRLSYISYVRKFCFVLACCQTYFMTFSTKGLQVHPVCYSVSMRHTVGTIQR